MGKEIQANLRLMTEVAAARLRSLAESDEPIDGDELLAEVRHIALVLVNVAESLETLAQLVVRQANGTIRDRDPNENFADG